MAKKTKKQPTLNTAKWTEEQHEAVQQFWDYIKALSRRAVDEALRAEAKSKKSKTKVVLNTEMAFSFLEEQIRYPEVDADTLMEAVNDHMHDLLYAAHNNVKPDRAFDHLT